MNRNHLTLISILSGAAAGVIVIGLIGRLAMAIVSLLTGSSANLSLSGVAEALVLGAVFGVVGGLLNVRLSRNESSGKVAQGVALGAILFALSIGISMTSTKMRIDFAGKQFFTLATAFGIYVVYGICVVTFVEKIKLKSGQKNR